MMTEWNKPNIESLNMTWIDAYFMRLCCNKNFTRKSACKPISSPFTNSISQCRFIKLEQWANKPCCDILETILKKVPTNHKKISTNIPNSPKTWIVTYDFHGWKKPFMCLSTVNDLDNIYSYLHPVMFHFCGFPSNRYQQRYPQGHQVNNKIPRA